MTWPRSPEDAAKLASGAWMTELRPVHLPGNTIAFRETIRPVTDFPEETGGSPSPARAQVKNGLVSRALRSLRRSGMSHKEARRLGLLP